MSRVLVGLIPARCGSKGIPHKNLRLVDGLSLVERAIRSALESGVIDQVWVSSDCEEVLEIAANSGCRPLRRSDLAASDSASANDVISEFLQGSFLTPESSILYLQPTSPFRSPASIRRGVAAHVSSGGKSVVGVRPVKDFPEKMLQIDDKTQSLVAVLDDSLASSNRQEFSIRWYPNGALYIFTVGGFKVAERIPISGSIPLRMSQLESLDVDSEADLLICEGVARDVYA